MRFKLEQVLIDKENEFIYKINDIVDIKRNKTKGHTGKIKRFGTLEIELDLSDKYNSRVISIPYNNIQSIEIVENMDNNNNNNEGE